MKLKQTKNLDALFFPLAAEHLSMGIRFLCGDLAGGHPILGGECCSKFVLEFIDKSTEQRSIIMRNS